VPPAPTIASLQSASRAHPGDGSAQCALGLVLRKAGKHRAAIAAFDRAASLNFQAGAAQSQVALGDRADALKRVSALAESQPFALAAILKAVGGIPQIEAEAQFHAALAGANAKRYPCRDRAESHQFDFWVGEWAVTDPGGQPLGVSSITRDLEGCVVRESWAGSLGGKGTSVNFYDPAIRQWHQVWTDVNGTITNYVGELRDGAMHFHAEAFGDADGVHQIRTLVFTPNPDGSVRQLFQDSDVGKEWKTTFDGHYVRTTQ
jgi:tetratricopeptide (TPR) repeat protein